MNRLGDAIASMTALYGAAEGQAAHEWSAALSAHDNHERAAHFAEHERWDRAATRRFKAIQRLVRALRDVTR